MYKLIAIDLDGTLLDSNKNISKENIEAIRLAESKGVKVIICSGRIFGGARIYAEEALLKEPLIACNGAIIKEMKTGRLLYEKTLKDEACYRIIEACHAENIYFHAYIGDTMYAERLEFSSLSYTEKNKKLPPERRVDVRVTVDMSHTIKNSERPASKIVIVSRDFEQLARARKKISEIPSIDVVSSDFDNFEVVSSGVSKGNALKFLAREMDISMSEVAAIGDNENDFSMIKEVGLGIAMQNAEQSLKEISDFITSSNDENGVAKAIKEYILL